jgi:hypothetical protein
MKAIITLVGIIIISSISYAQITKEGIEQLLIAQGIDNPKPQAEALYNQYTDNKQFDIMEMNKAFMESAVSGICMGFYQARNFKYKNVGWMPQFMQDWYSTRMKTETIFGKSFTWQKIWRESDYMTDRLAYEDLNRFYNNKWYLTAITHLVLKNLSGSMIKNKMRIGQLF